VLIASQRETELGAGVSQPVSYQSVLAAASSEPIAAATDKRDVADRSIASR